MASTEAEERRARAMECKDHGNLLYQLTDYEGAVGHFTKGLQHDPTAHVLLSNRSAAYVKLGQHERALEDAQRCTQMRPSWAKGWGRLGTALLLLGRPAKALDAFETGVSHDAQHAGCIDGIALAREALAAEARALSQVTHTATVGGTTVGTTDSAVAVSASLKRKHAEMTVGVPETVIWVEDGQKRKRLAEIVGAQSGAFSLPCLVLVEEDAGAPLLASWIAKRTRHAAIAVREAASDREAMATMDADSHGFFVAPFSFLQRSLSFVPSTLVFFDIPLELGLYVPRASRRVFSFVNQGQHKVFTELVEEWDARGVTVPLPVLASPWNKGRKTKQGRGTGVACVGSGGGGGERVDVFPP